MSAQRACPTCGAATVASTDADCSRCGAGLQRASGRAQRKRCPIARSTPGRNGTGQPGQLIAVVGLLVISALVVFVSFAARAELG
jgi:hypothetical protein